MVSADIQENKFYFCRHGPLCYQINWRKFVILKVLRVRFEIFEKIYFIWASSLSFCCCFDVNFKGTCDRLFQVTHPDSYQWIISTLSGFIEMWIKSFKWGTVHSCRSRDCKNIRGQSWRSIRNCWLSQIRDWRAGGPAEVADFFPPPTLTFDIFAAS